MRTKRRPQERSRHTREKILTTSLRLFKKKGFDETSMRDIAEEAGLALGGAYYYFRTKDELVLAFYARTQEEAEERNEQTRARTTRFEERFADIVVFKLGQLAPYRKLVTVLARNAADPRKKLSPFSPETSEIRNRSILVVERALDGSDIKVQRSLRPYLPRLFWIFQMGIIFYWVHDHSRNQERTEKLLELGLKIVIPLIRLSKLPLMSPTTRMLRELLDLLDKDFATSPVRE